MVLPTNITKDELLTLPENPRYALDLEDHIKILGFDSHFRIVALRDFADVKAGDKGGYVHPSCVIDHEGTSWVYPGAVLMEGCYMTGHAMLIDSEGPERVMRDYGYVDCSAKNTELYHYAVIRNSKVTDSRLQGFANINNSEVNSSDISGNVEMDDCRFNSMELNGDLRYIHASCWGPVLRNFTPKAHYNAAKMHILANGPRNMPQELREYMSFGFNPAPVPVEVVEESIDPVGGLEDELYAGMMGDAHAPA